MSTNTTNGGESYTVVCGGREYTLPVRYQDPVAIGHGNFGTVIRATDTETNQYVAIKKKLQPFGTPTHAKRTYRELKLLIHLNHPDAQVVQLYNAFTPEKNLHDFQTLYFVFNFVDYDLNKVIRYQKPFREDIIKQIIYSILRGLKFIHSAGIIHRDLKPTNIGIDKESNITILDFASSCGFSNDNHTTYIGTRWWRALEVYINRKKYSEKLDIWSVGCIMAELILLRTLFRGSGPVDQLNKIFDVLGTPDLRTLNEICEPGVVPYVSGLPLKPKQDFNELFGFKYDQATQNPISGVSPQGVDLLDRLLSLDQRVRPTAEEALAHPFFQDLHDPTDDPTKELLFDEHEDKDYSISKWKSIIWQMVEEFVPPSWITDDSSDDDMKCEKFEKIIEFRLNQDNQIFNTDQLSTNLKIENANENQNIIILCIGVELFDKNMFPTDNIQSYDNPFKFIAKTLSVKDKTIYLIISTDKSHSIIPIIHKHYCIEKIYLYRSTNAKSSFTESSISEKISGPYPDMKNLCDQITNDTKILMEKPLRWDRSLDLFTMLHTQRQQLENQYTIIKGSADMPRDERIVIFHCNNRKLFHSDQISIPVSEFTNANECIQLINEQTRAQIFLIIAGSTIPLEIQSIFDSEQMYAIYFFCNNELKYPMNKRKVSGLFDKLEDLSGQLHKDILFYREQHVHTARIDMFPSIEQTQKLISHLNEKQIVFLTCNLFIDILPQTPLLKFELEDLIKICDILFPNNGKETANYVNQLHKEGDEVKNLYQDPRFSQIVLKLHQLNQLNNLFMLQKPLIDIQKRVFEPVDICKTDTVYLTRIISNDTLEIVKSSCGEFISIGIFILATKSLLIARTIARKAANDGLISVLFQIEAVDSTHLLEIDSNRVIFRFGSVFRLESINRAPDGVYYVKIKPADSKFQSIKEQLQFETEVPLSWLTYGNYLYFLKQPQQAKTYFEYLLEKLPPGHINRPSIYNNMALIYTMENGKDERTKAEMIYDVALKCAQSVKSDSTASEYKDQTCIAIPTTNATLPKTIIDRSTVLGSIADVYYQKDDYKLALDHYKQALELSIDLNCRSYYQKMIETVKKNI